MNNEIKNLLLTALFGFVICVILGLLFYGTSIFFICRLPSSVVVADGFYGAVFYSVLRYCKTKEQILTGIALLILQIIIWGKLAHITFLIRDFVFMLSLFGSIICYNLFINKYSSIPLFLRSFALPLLLGLFNILATLILIIIFNPSAVKINYALFHNAQFAAIIGLGLGIGFDLYEIMKNKLFLKRI
jgi:hypothetical protein